MRWLRVTALEARKRSIFAQLAPCGIFYFLPWTWSLMERVSKLAWAPLWITVHEFSSCSASPFFSSSSCLVGELSNTVQTHHPLTLLWTCCWAWWFYVHAFFIWAQCGSSASLHIHQNKKDRQNPLPYWVSVIIISQPCLEACSLFRCSLHKANFSSTAFYCG